MTLSLRMDQPDPVFILDLREAPDGRLRELRLSGITSGEAHAIYRGLMAYYADLDAELARARGENE